MIGDAGGVRVAFLFLLSVGKRGLFAKHQGAPHRRSYPGLTLISPPLRTRGISGSRGFLVPLTGTLVVVSVGGTISIPALHLELLVLATVREMGEPLPRCL